MRWRNLRVRQETKARPHNPVTVTHVEPTRSDRSAERRRIARRKGLSPRIGQRGRSVS